MALVETIDMIKVDLTQFNAWAKKLYNLPLPRIHSEIGQIGVDRVQSTFNGQKSFDGIPWKPLSIVTIKARSDRGSTSSRILMDTLALYNSINFQSSKSSAVLSVGSQSRDASVHNFGDPNNVFRGKVAPIPARPFIPNDQNIPRDWIEDFKFPVIEALKDTVK